MEVSLRCFVSRNSRPTEVSFKELNDLHLGKKEIILGKDMELEHISQFH